MTLKSIRGSCYLFSLSGAEFSHNFIKFNHTFKRKDKPYKKMPYSIWQDLNRHEGAFDVSVELNAVTEDIKVWAGRICSDEIRQCGTSASPPYCFHCRDSSFGQFLYEELLKTGVDKANMESTTITNGSYVKSYDITNIDGLTLQVMDDGVFNSVLIPADSTGTITAWDAIASTSNITDKIREHEDKYHNNKENENMKFANFDFGPCTNDNIRMSMYGLAVKNASGAWVSYDANSLSIMDVDCFNFEGGKYLYKMPVAIHDIAVGDVVIHARRPMFVVSVDPHTLTVVDPVDGEAKSIMPTKSPFGFNFATKVVNLLGGMMNGVDANNPFGNLWMLMLMDDKSKNNDMLPLMMMMNGGNANMNPMMMYMLMKDGNMSDNMLPLMLMMNGGNMFPNQNCGRGNHRCGGHTAVYDPVMPDPENACEVSTEDTES